MTRSRIPVHRQRDAAMDDAAPSNPSLVELNRIAPNFETPIESIPQAELVEHCKTLKLNLDRAYEDNASTQDELTCLRSELAGWKDEVIKMQNHLQLISSQQALSREL